MDSHRNNKKRLTIACRVVEKLFLTSILFTLFSCTDEVISPAESFSTLRFAPTLGSYGFDDGQIGSIEDNTIKDLRILVFDNAGSFLENKYIPDITGTMPFELPLLPGTYSFVFIANESSDAALHTLLGSWGSGKSLADVTTLRFASSAFEAGKNIPMSAIYREVKILASGQYIIGGITYTSTWSVQMKRLGIRVDMRIKTTSQAKQQAFTKLDLYNIPKNVPVLEEDLSGNTLYNGGAGNYETTERSYAVNAGDQGGWLMVGGEYEWVKSGIILPSSVFTPDSEASAIKFRANYSGQDPETAVLKAGSTNLHQALRNTYFFVNATLKPNALEVETNIQDWDEYLINPDLITKINLHVSAITAHVTEYHVARILFSSDQPNVYLEPQTREGYPMDNIFYGLTGENAYNFHYEYDEATGQGTGYFDLIVDRNKPLLTTQKKMNAVITLNASGLKRTIKTNMTIAPAEFGKYHYVGAFWRNDQVGERLISMKTWSTNGSWIAQVVAGEDWIVLDDKKSLDPDLWTANPGDPELYPVDSKLTKVSGSGNIFFRIGLTGTNPGNTPRYGLIEISNGPTSVYLYVRQGEDEDYVMRPEDTNGSGAWLGTTSDTQPRPLAVKFTPYNLTAQRYIDNTTSPGNSLSSYPKLDIHGGVFTPYPSQAGAHFLWSAQQPTSSYARVAIPPSYPYYSNITGYPTEGATSSGYWNTDKVSFEICPEGYRRVNDGAENGRVSSSYVRTSEIRQSLWLNPKDGSTFYVTDNSVFGYYADGFFDRRVIEDANDLYSESFDEIAVEPMSTHVAYAGRLFFNPFTNASIFFPALGYRVVGTGFLIGAGKQGQYWTSSSSAASSSFHLVIGNDTYGSPAGIAFFNRNYGYGIRCVAD